MNLDIFHLLQQNFTVLQLRSKAFSILKLPCQIDHEVFELSKALYLINIKGETSTSVEKLMIK